MIEQFAKLLGTQNDSFVRLTMSASAEINARRD